MPQKNEKDQTEKSGKKTERAESVAEGTKLQSCPAEKPPVSNQAEAPSSGLSSFARYNLLILDWDDTVMPTAWLQTQVPVSLGIPDDPNPLGRLLMKQPPLLLDQSKALDEVDAVANRVIGGMYERAHNVRIVIVTNALGSWVADSAKSFLPDTWVTMKKWDIGIVNARGKNPTASELQQIEGTNMKIQAFRIFEEMKSFYSAVLEESSRSKDGGDGGHREILLNLMAVGDQEADREAFILAANLFLDSIKSTARRRPSLS
uniref:Uncharacterized protein n=1 Tax=Chromera velia CCMP2878 TaxID=1169474 RepID=A0A0G4HLX8_9ALVE|eukprot:Cvel_7433.t1-p1 / transcript=Cvel_7433.t1 / gene=Cvel_7433 / organism=Chromera_velia_CCMP2878 / gene_product=hypothetical protein / transcript_product=hypothetical protein / location=Cvel_scaffold388:61936-64164(-) / protein_length=260 / sequence_SO=supercontig / SO=protein_coding / is_pseudo=false